MIKYTKTAPDFWKISVEFRWAEDAVHVGCIHREYRRKKPRYPEDEHIPEDESYLLHMPGYSGPRVFLLKDAKRQVDIHLGYLLRRLMQDEFYNHRQRTEQDD